MNYYNKLAKYIGKWNNFKGGVRTYTFKPEGFEELDADISVKLSELKDSDVQKKFPIIINNEIKQTVDDKDRKNFDDKMRVILYFYPRFDELWLSLYLHIVNPNPEGSTQPGWIYFNEIYLKEKKEEKHGLDIIKSIYDKLKEVQKFKDGDDICIHGYNPHKNEDCKSFTGKPNPKLLHWPNKPCIHDNDPKGPKNNSTGCGSHRNKTCKFLHEKTVTRIDKKDCIQIQFQIVALDSSKDIAPVVFYKGFQTLPNMGKWLP